MKVYTCTLMSDMEDKTVLSPKKDLKSSNVHVEATAI